MNTKHCDWFSLKGETVTYIEHADDRISILTKSGRRISLSHFQDCCESVRLVRQSRPSIPFGTIVLAEEDSPDDPKWWADYQNDSHTWTRFRAVSENGAELDLWWLGESNGYYSENVQVEEVV